MSGDRFAEQYRQLITDPKSRAALIADPKAALAEYFGAVIDGEYRIEIIEQRSDTITAAIPAAPERGISSAARLSEVSGRVYDMGVERLEALREAGDTTRRDACGQVGQRTHLVPERLVQVVPGLERAYDPTV